MSNIRLVPSNGIYLTANDNPSYADVICEKYNCSTDHIQNITFIVTEACQLFCEYCYQTNKTNRKMTKEVAKESVDMLFDKERINGYFDYDKSVAIVLDFIGGEPLLETDLIDFIVDYFLYKCLENAKIWGWNYRIAISTNGILYDSDAVQKFLNKNNGKISIGVTVDGTKEMHDKCRVDKNGDGSYDVASQALMSLRSKNPRQATKVTICPENLNGLFSSIKSLHEEIGLNFIHANCVFEDVWRDEHPALYKEQLLQIANYLLEDKRYSKLYCSLFSESIGAEVVDWDKNYCGGNGKMLAIGVDGTLYPCQRYSSCSMSSGRQPLIIGDIWNGIGYTSKNLRNVASVKSITLNTQSPQKCKDCTIGQGCGLCTAYNYDIFGDANIRATYICEMHKVLVEVNRYFWNELKRREGI